MGEGRSQYVPIPQQLLTESFAGPRFAAVAPVRPCLPVTRYANVWDDQIGINS